MICSKLWIQRWVDLPSGMTEERSTRRMLYNIYVSVLWRVYIKSVFSARAISLKLVETRMYALKIRAIFNSAKLLLNRSDFLKQTATNNSYNMSNRIVRNPQTWRTYLVKLIFRTILNKRFKSTNNKKHLVLY